MTHPPDESRRRFLRAIAVAPIVLAAPGAAGLMARARAEDAPLLRPTPACGDDDDDDPTPAQTEGPFFKPRSPKRTSLMEAGIKGTQLVIAGTVLTRSCRPVPNALLDFWQADNEGVYDNSGFKLRGHQFTDERGVFRLETILPALYQGRTRHIHVKVQAPDDRILTTQLYFAGEAQNARDSLFDPELVIAVEAGSSGKEGRYHFVLDRP
ncbi:MAG: hypothetical protein ACREMQ_14050 [Longimicrobiales bacterium]